MSSAYHSEGILLDPTSTQLRSLFVSLIKYVPATIPENREHFVGMMKSGIFPVAVMEYDEPLLERLLGLKSTGKILSQIIVQTMASTSSAPACMKISFLNTAMAYEMTLPVK